MPYYLKYDDRTIGPIAPDNPKWDFDDHRVMFKCKTFAKEMMKDFKVDYEVIRADPKETD